MKGLLYIMLLLIHWLPSLGQDSVRFSVDEVRLIALQQTDLRECRGLLQLERLEVFTKDSIIAVLNNTIRGFNSELIIKDRVIDIERSRAVALESTVRKEKKKRVVTVGVATIISALCLFIAIK